MPLAPVPFHRKISSLNTDKGRSGLKVLFYVGCLIDKIFPQLDQDVIDVLNYHEVGIFMPRKQGCCGIPAISSGDMKTFNRLLRHHLKIFDVEKFDYLVTACATCTSTIKKIWPMMVDKDSDAMKSGVASIAQKTLDISQFLVSKVGLEKSAAEDIDTIVDVTFHDPCHLKKSLGVAAEPRALINANPRYRLKEMHEADRCCGLGGSFNLHYYELSSNIGKAKRNNIKASGSSVVATGCPACILQISDMLSQSDDNIVVKHPIEIYRELIKINGNHT
jgi:glycolate oxidase iron-sulfur subunit